MAHAVCLPEPPAVSLITGRPLREDDANPDPLALDLLAGTLLLRTEPLIPDPPEPTR